MWDERYDTEQYLYGREPNTFLEENFRAIQMGRILCLGEGEGRNAVFLAEQGYEVTAMDSSSVGLEKVNKLALEKGVDVKTLHADLSDFDMGRDRWEGVISFFCHLPPLLRESVHSRVVQSLKKGGVLILEAYTPSQIRLGTGGPNREDMMMTEILLKKELDGLDFSLLHELERDMSEGILHKGRGAVVQLIGIK